MKRLFTILLLSAVCFMQPASAATANCDSDGSVYVRPATFRELPVSARYLLPVACVAQNLNMVNQDAIEGLRVVMYVANTRIPDPHRPGQIWEHEATHTFQLTIHLAPGEFVLLVAGRTINRIPPADQVRDGTGLANVVAAIKARKPPRTYITASIEELHPEAYTACPGSSGYCPEVVNSPGPFCVSLLDGAPLNLCNIGFTNVSGSVDMYSSAYVEWCDPQYCYPSLGTWEITSYDWYEVACNPCSWTVLATGTHGTGNGFSQCGWVKSSTADSGATYNQGCRSVPAAHGFDVMDGFDNLWDAYEAEYFCTQSRAG